jgi:hypothetical protein
MKELLFRVLGACAIAGSTAFAENIFGLDMSNRIYRFDSDTPGALSFLNGGHSDFGTAGRRVSRGDRFSTGRDELDRGRV